MISFIWFFFLAFALWINYLIKVKSFYVWLCFKNAFILFGVSGSLVMILAISYKISPPPRTFYANNLILSKLCRCAWIISGFTAGLFNTADSYANGIVNFYRPIRIIQSMIVNLCNYILIYSDYIAIIYSITWYILNRPVDIYKIYHKIKSYIVNFYRPILNVFSCIVHFYNPFRLNLIPPTYFLNSTRPTNFSSSHTPIHISMNLPITFNFTLITVRRTSGSSYISI